MKKTVSAIKNNKYFFIIFLFILAIGFIHYDSEAGLNDYRLCLYLPDFSIGFCSHCLVGSFISLFRKTLTVKWITGYCEVIYAVTAFLTAAVLNHVFRHCGSNVKLSTMLVIAMPAGIGYFAVWLGMLDIYWYIFTLLALVCLQNRYLRWLLPLLSFLCLAVRYVAAVTFFPVFAAVLMFKIAEDRHNKPLIILFIITVFVSVAAGIYFVFFASKTITMSEDEVYSYLNSKLPVNQESTLFYLFGRTRTGYTDGASGILGTSLNVNSGNLDGKTFISIIASFAPLIAVIISVYVNAFRESDAFGRLTCILCIAFNAVPFAMSIFSADYIRWFSLLNIAQAMIIIYLVYTGHNAVTKGFRKTTDFLKSKPLLLALLCYISLIYQSRII